MAKLELPRQISTRVWVVVCAVAILIASVLYAWVGRDGRSLADAVRELMLPFIAAGVAVTSLVASAVAAMRETVDKRREATLRAYSEYSDATREARERLLAVGEGAWDLALATQFSQPCSDHADLVAGHDADACTNTRMDTLLVLNGIERLAIGERLGAYDIEVIAALGGHGIRGIIEKVKRAINVRRSREIADVGYAYTYTEALRLDEALAGIAAKRRP